MKHAIVAISESLPSVATILGQRQVRIPTGGKIRAGIKVLTKSAAAHPTAKQIYERGVAGNQSFEEIECAIIQVLPNIKTPLVPKNVAWFTVRPNDFPNPETAGQILDAFGEDRGDGIKRLYRFPVIFPADMWQVVMPHELVTWGANEKKFWSEYSPDGRVRYCKCYAPVPMDHSGKRAIRVFGGRKTIVRDQNDGICNPECCHEFQTRQCNLSGRFIFFIPGIKSIDAFELHTNSFYAMSRAIEQFETLAFLRGGRISGFLDDKRTPFYLTKKLRDVPHIDETGRAVRAAHWIIELEAPIDVTALLRANDDDSVLANADEAAHVLEGTRHGANLETEGAKAFGNDVRGLNGNSSADDDGIGYWVESAPNAHGDQAAAATPRKATATHQGRNPPPSHDGAPSKEQVIAAAGEFGIDAVRYEAYAECHWGPGWMLNANGRHRALDEIDRYKNDPDTFVDKVDAELTAAQKRV
ncbi:hypothetical protein [Herbaspirillum sp. ST 5-3]|uniref:recombination directionality factor n=1 Tax=Oxalobacteraceae TaxID=75682 RepID=UPI0010A3C30F|nr:hypothetical protein [Herbaspirillum sp. ST 5-3]